jgi:hypothetical protein
MRTQGESYLPHCFSEGSIDFALGASCYFDSDQNSVCSGHGLMNMEPETIMVREQGLTTREARAPIRTPRGHAQQVSKECCFPGLHDGSLAVI